MFTAYANYWDFRGRAGRAEYWWYVLLLMVLSLAAFLVDANVFHDGGLFGPCYLVTSFANLIPSLSLGTRRLHDIGRSGWWQLIMIVPLVGPVALIVMAALPSQPQENRFGPPPGRRSYEDLHATFA